MTTHHTNGNQIAALSSGKFIATESGLVVNGSPSFDEWMAYGKSLQRINQALQMIIGDWLNEGEKRYSETYAQATALWPEAHLETLKNWKWVAGRVEKSLRDDVLHYSHYAVVAPLPKPEQADWLMVAKAKKLSSRDLRQAIRGEPDKPREPTFAQDFLAVTDALDDLNAREDKPEEVKPYMTAAVQAMEEALIALSALEKEKVGAK